MNLALVTSYIIAGMLTLSLIMMNLRVSNNSTELTLTQITRQHMVDVTEILNDDISNMGYDVDQKSSQILTYASDDEIRFYRNIQNDPSRLPELVTWKFFPGDSVATAKNPNLRVLRRIVDDPNSGTQEVTEIESGVTRFELKYYEKRGENLANNMTPPGSGSAVSDIKQIYVVLEMQSKEPVILNPNSDDRYVRSVYEKRFTPANLE